MTKERKEGRYLKETYFIWKWLHLEMVSFPHDEWNCIRRVYIVFYCHMTSLVNIGTVKPPNNYTASPQMSTHVNGSKSYFPEAFQ